MRFTKYFICLTCLFTTITNESYSQDIPTSRRAEIAINETSPALKAAFKKHGLKWGAAVYIRIFKQENVLEIWAQQGRTFKLFKSYPICTFSGTLGPKTKEGDNQAPEGFYFVTPRQLNPHSQFHLSFNLGYPNRYDQSHDRTGSALMVHGNCVSIGCYAMGDRQIEEIYALIHSAFKHGQPFFRAHIFPFKMENLEQYKSHSWYRFWRNLKQGYDLFEQTKRVPDVQVKNRQYVFSLSPA